MDMVYLDLKPILSVPIELTCIKQQIYISI